jgi:hypothetical protein
MSPSTNPAPHIHWLCFSPQPLFGWLRACQGLPVTPAWQNQPSSRSATQQPCTGVFWKNLAILVLHLCTKKTKRQKIRLYTGTNRERERTQEKPCKPQPWISATGGSLECSWDQNKLKKKQLCRHTDLTFM